MKRNPVYVFNGESSVGIFHIPLESIIHTIDSDGSGTPSMTQIIGKVGLTPISTIGHYLATTNNYKELDRYIDFLDEITDVNISTAADGDILVFDSVTNNWVNTNIIDGGTY